MIQITDEGQHGTISAADHKLVGTVTAVGAEGFRFQLDGVRTTNWFSRDEWTLTPDPKPLPTEPGSVISVDDGQRIYGRTLNGWLRLNAHYYTQPIHHEDGHFEPHGDVVVLFDAGANH